jgi:hypothetical protein
MPRVAKRKIGLMVENYLQLSVEAGIGHQLEFWMNQVMLRSAASSDAEARPAQLDISARHLCSRLSLNAIRNASLDFSRYQ